MTERHNDGTNYLMEPIDNSNSMHYDKSSFLDRLIGGIEIVRQPYKMCTNINFIGTYHQLW